MAFTLTAISQFCPQIMKSLHACRINLPGLCSHILISETVLVTMRREKMWHQKLHFKSLIWWSVFGNNALAFLIARGYGLYGKSKDGIINYSNPRCKHKPKASDLDAKF